MTLLNVESKINTIFSFNNSDKGAVTHAVVHRALWEYLSAINVLSDETESEKLRQEMFDRYEGKILHLKFCVNLSTAARKL